MDSCVGQCKWELLLRGARNWRRELGGPETRPDRGRVWVAASSSSAATAVAFTSV